MAAPKLSVTPKITKRIVKLRAELAELEKAYSGVTVTVDWEAIIAEIVRKRHELGITQKELSVLIGKNRTTITNTEAMRQVPPVEIFTTICVHLGLRFGILLDKYTIVDSVTGRVVGEPQPNASTQSEIESDGKVYQ